ncbi:MAG: hypothetical protein EAZ85_06265, partial [Bacteroidetes bacterium]
MAQKYFYPFYNKKYFLGALICIFLSSFLSLKAQITSTGTGNWSTPALWTGGVVPGAGDNVVIAAGHTITVDMPASCNNLSINGTGILSLDSDPFTVNGTTIVGGTLQDGVGGGGSDNTFSGAFTINSGGLVSNTGGNSSWYFNNTLTVNSGGTLNNMAGNSSWYFQSNITNAGTFSLISNASYEFSNNLTITANNSMTFGGGTGSGTIASLRNVTVNDGNFPISMSGTLNVLGTLTNNLQNNTLSVGNMTGTGTFINGAGAYLRISSSAAPGITNFNCTAAGNLVYYDIASAQTIRGTTYHHLTLGDMATKTLGGNITINGDLLVSAVTSFNTNGFTITSLGNIAINGSIAGTQDFILQGGINTSFSSASALTFNTLVINKTNSNNTITFSRAVTIATQLTLTNGRMILGGILTMNMSTTLAPATPSANSYIINNGFDFTRLTLNAGGTYYFPVGDLSNSKMVVLTIGGTNGTSSVRFTNTISPTPPATAFNTPGGMWTITSPDVGNITFSNPCPNMGIQPTVYRNTAGWTPLTTNYFSSDASVLSQSGLSGTNFMLYSLLNPPTALTANGNTTNFFNANWAFVPGADKYFIDVATTSDFSSGVILNNQDAGNNNGIPLAGLTPNTTYFYRVRAFVNVGSITSTNSNVKMTSTYIGVGAGNSISLNGTTQKIDVVNNNAFNFNDTRTFTLEAWIRLNTIGTEMDIISKRIFASNGYALVVTSGGNLGVVRNNSLSGGSGILPINQWVHVAVSFSVGGGFTTYINGQIDTNGSSTGITSNTSNLTFGSRPDNGFPFNGQIDEVKIWNTTRTQAEIQAKMCSKLIGNESGLVAYFRLDEGGTGNFVENKALNANFDGTLVNSPARILSTAPIGDISIAGTSSANITLNDTTPFVDAFTLSNITGSPTSHHIYKIEAPSNISTPPTNYLSVYNNQYYGVFFVGGTNPQGTIAYSYSNTPNISNSNALRFARRDNVNSATWSRYGGVVNRQNRTVNRLRAVSGEYILAARSGIMSNARNAGTALSFAGANFGTATNSLTDTDFSVEFWVKPTSNAPTGFFSWEQGNRLVDFSNVSNLSDCGISLLNIGEIVIAFGTRNSSGISNTVLSTPLVPDNWYHVTVTRNKTTNLLQLYINGKLDNSTTSTASILTFPSSVSFGRRNGGGNQSDATIDEIKFWNTVVDGNTIKDWLNLRANSSHPNFNNLVGYYRCDEATDMFAEDLANGNEANLTANSLWTTGTQPLGDGATQRFNVTTPNSVQNFVNSGLQITFGSGTVPNGDIVVTRLDTAPESYPNVAGMNFVSCYWVIRNYGTNLTFSQLNEMKFEVPANNTISAADLATPSNIKLFKRPDNATGNTWGTPVASATGFGSVKFAGPPTGAGNVITEFSQFIFGSLNSSLAVSWVNFDGQR